VPARYSAGGTGIPTCRARPASPRATMNPRAPDVSEDPTAVRADRIRDDRSMARGPSRHATHDRGDFGRRIVDREARSFNGESPPAHATTTILVYLFDRKTERMIEGNDGGANISFKAEPHGRRFTTEDRNRSIARHRPTVSLPRLRHAAGPTTSRSVPSARMGVLTRPTASYTGTANRASSPSAEGPQHRICRPSAPARAAPAHAALRPPHAPAQALNVWARESTGIAPTDLEVTAFAWTHPIVFSPNDPTRSYVGGNCGFASRGEA